MHDINKFGSREMESLMTTTGDKRNEFILKVALIEIAFGRKGICILPQVKSTFNSNGYFRWRTCRHVHRMM